MDAKYKSLGEIQNALHDGGLMLSADAVYVLDGGDVFLYDGEDRLYEGGERELLGEFLEMMGFKKEEC